MKKLLLTLPMLLFTVWASAQVPTDSLRGYYTFNGNMNDVSGKSNHFIPFNQANNVTNFSVARNAASGNAINNQTTGYFLASPLKSTDTNSFSISLWINMAAVDQGNTVTILGDYKVEVDPMLNSFSNGRFRITMYNKNPQFYLYTDNGQVLIDDFVDSISLNTWNHLAATYNHDTKEAKFFVNGKQVSTTRTLTKSPRAPQSIDLGRIFVRRFNFNAPPTTSTEGKFNGSIDDIAIYTRVISACEINALAEQAPATFIATAEANELNLTAYPSGAESYQWINCVTGQAVAAATSAIFIAPQAGSYKVVVKTSCASDTSDCVNVSASQFPSEGLVGRYMFNSDINDASNRNIPLKYITYANNQNAIFGNNRKGSASSALNNTNGTFLYGSALFNDLLADTTDFTTSLWIKANNAVNQDAFVLSDFAANNGNVTGTFYIRIINNKLRAGIVDQNFAVQFVESNVEIDNQAWYNIQLTCDRKNETVILYLNGKEIASLRNFGRLRNAQAMYIGAYFKEESGVVSKGLPFNGLIDDIHVYNRVLNSCELATLAESNIETTIYRNENTLIVNTTGVNYQWINCNTGAVISGATQRSFSPAIDGNYAVVVSGNCGIDTSNCIAVTGTTGINEYEQQMLNIYPNPAQNEIIINGITVNNISIVDVLGRECITTAENRIHIASLAKGVYYVNVITANGTKITKKIIKE